MIMIVQICLWHLTQMFPSLLSHDHDCSDMSVTCDSDFWESADNQWLWVFRYVCDMWPRLFRVCWQWQTMTTVAKMLIEMLGFYNIYIYFISSVSNCSSAVSFNIILPTWCSYSVVFCFQGSMMPDSDSSFGGGGDMNRPPTRSSVTCKCHVADFLMTMFNMWQDWNIAHC